ncbi:hypothetical protein [Burkholderia pseudomallei]|uniref:hypothetical protein n=1 Tax=Burkholderia pseudomallei TaxID=28450 RepID=UPI0011774AD7|nr:hypothetical protein [Burkholderia pseudomallei]
MSFKTTPEHLSSLVEALRQKEPVRPMHADVEEALRRFALNGCALRYEVEDVLVAMDSRLGLYGGAGNVEALAAMFDIRLQNVARRPAKHSSGVVFYPALLVADLAYLLINLEAIGFRVIPELLVDLLLPAIKSAKFLSHAELSIFWYQQTRHRGPPLTISLASARGDQPTDVIEWKPIDGYRLRVWFSSENIPVRLISNSPKYRRRPESVRVECLECGQIYYRGDPESSAAHRGEHRSRMWYLDPRPHPRLRGTERAHPYSIPVDASSPKWMHREMYDRASAFRREFGYDFIQWGSSTGCDDPDAQGFLFCDAAGAIVGACAFWLSRDTEESRWALKWVWICPRHRRDGHLSFHWNSFRTRFGDFHVESPVSEAMRAFLAKCGDLALMQGESASGSTR